jgi:hypothetical protein
LVLKLLDSGATCLNQAKGGIMNKLFISIVFFMLCGCGLETAGTAATGASLKKQELEEGQKTMQRVEDRMGQMNEQMQDRMKGLED